MKKLSKKAKEFLKACKLSKKFFGFDPRYAKKISIKWPKAVMQIGGCARVDYVNDKWHGELTQYFHLFEGDCVILAAPEKQPDGDNILIIKGKFNITADGIIG